MINRNIQMKKKKEDGTWDNLYPLTFNENVFNSTGENLDEQFTKVNQDITAVETDINNLSEKTATQLSKIKNRTQIAPDDFEGSDAEKIEQAFHYAINNKISVISLTREYDVTGKTIYFPLNSIFEFEQIVFKGGIIRKDDSGFVFSAYENDRRRNSPHFENTIFIGGDNTYLYNGDKMIRQNVTSCTFYRMGLVRSSEYLQTVRLLNCETGQLGCHFIHAENAFDLLIDGHRGESNTHPDHVFIYINREDYNITATNLRIVDSLLEGYTRNPPIKIGPAHGLVIENSYFEGNKGDIEILKNPSGYTLMTGKIANNTFTESLGEYNIIVNAATQRTTNFKIKENTSNIKTSLTDFTGWWDPDSKNHMVSGGTESIEETVSYERGHGYSVTEVSLDGGIAFEISLSVQHVDYLINLDNLQFLVNFRFNFGSSTVYTAHLTGIVSIDGAYIDGKLNAGLNLSVLSERNTGGNINGNIANDPSFDYYFKESGTKILDSYAKTATIVVAFDQGKRANKNSGRCIPLNSLIGEYYQL